MVCRKRGNYFLKACKICNKSFYTTSKHSSDKCIDHIKKGLPKRKSGFIGFWSKKLRAQLMAKEFPFDPKEEVLRKMLK